MSQTKNMKEQTVDTSSSFKHLRDMRNIKVFMMEDGHKFFRQMSGEKFENPDGIYGWSKLLTNPDVTMLRGGHMQPFKGEDNIEKIMQHFSNDDWLAEWKALNPKRITSIAPETSLPLVPARTAIALSPELPSSSQVRVSEPLGTVLITGGLGGLGIITAQVLARKGATCVVLASRSGQIKHVGQGLEERLASLQRRGDVKIVIEKCDMSVESDVVDMLNRVRTEHGPLTGIFHTAGVTKDALIEFQTPETIRYVMGPKADGARFLHKHTQQDPLQHFVLYSSISALIGTIGQANYAAANGYLDGLAENRVKQGLPAVSIQWPAVSGVGMAAAMNIPGLVERDVSINVNKFIDILEWIVFYRDTKKPVHSIIPDGLLRPGALPPWCDWLLKRVRKERNLKPRFRVSGGAVSVKKRMSAKQIANHVNNVVAEAVGEPDVGGDVELIESGLLDSLGVTQMIGTLAHKLQITLESSFIQDFPTIDKLVEELIVRTNSQPLMISESSSSVDKLPSALVSMVKDALTHFEPRPHRKGDSANDNCLHCLNAGNPDLVPVVFTYTVFGTTVGHELVARFGDRPVFALQTPELTSSIRFNDLKERAQFHFDEIRRTFRSDQPLELVGYSAGCVLASFISHLMKANEMLYRLTLFEFMPLRQLKSADFSVEMRRFFLSVLSRELGAAISARPVIDAWHDDLFIFKSLDNDESLTEGVHKFLTAIGHNFVCAQGSMNRDPFVDSCFKQGE